MSGDADIGVNVIKYVYKDVELASSQIDKGLKTQADGWFSVDASNKTPTKFKLKCFIPFVP